MSSDEQKFTQIIEFKDIPIGTEFILFQPLLGPGPEIYRKDNNGPAYENVAEYHRKWYHLFWKTVTYKLVTVNKGAAAMKSMGYCAGTFFSPDTKCLIESEDLETLYENLRKGN